MTKAELIERIAKSRSLPPEITKKDISTILGVAFEELAVYFAKAKVTRQSSPRFTFPRFGTFTKKKKKARRGVNPRTLEPMQIDACHSLDFKASRELRESMNGGTDSGAARKQSPKRTTKASVKSSKKNKKARAADRGRRRLTPRDEDAEIDALIDDDGLFDELPASPMQRVRPNSRRARTG